MGDSPALMGPVTESLHALGRVTGSLRLLPPPVLFEAAMHAGVPSTRLTLRRPDVGGLLVTVFRNSRPVMVFSPSDGRSLADLLAAAGVVGSDMLRRLADERPRAAQSLQRLAIEHAGMDLQAVQKLLDFQARQRLLDALVWRDGHFQFEEYSGAEETDFDLALPSVHSLMIRARAREERLPALLASLPDAPENTLVRRRRGGDRALSVLEDGILREARAPLLLTQLLARTLVDDDILLDAVLSLVDRGAVRLEPRARLVPDRADERGSDLRADSLIRAILGGRRGSTSAQGPVSLWLVAAGADFELARGLVSRLGQAGMPGSGAASFNGVASITLRPTTEVSVCVLAVHTAALTRGALEGVMSRCDGLILVRDRDGDAEVEKLRRVTETLMSVRRGEGWVPPLLGLELGARFRRWEPFPDAVLGVPEPDLMSPTEMLTSLLEGVLGATRGQQSPSP